MRGLTCLALIAGMATLHGLTEWWPESATRPSGDSWRSALANAFWIQAYGAWLEKDRERLLDRYRVATALDSQNLRYWRLAAQTIAQDLPYWESGGIPDSKMKRKYGEMALAFFERSQPYFRDDPYWYMAGGFLAESALEDPVRALRYMETAVALPRFPYAAGRTYARLLLEQGKAEEAQGFLKSWIAELDEDPIAVRAQSVRAWIEQLERKSIPE